MSWANGPIYHAQELLKATLEACANWNGRAIYFGALPEPAGNKVSHTLAELEAFRPYAIISTDAENGFRAFVDADGEGFVYGGRLIVEITENVPSGIASDPAAVDARIIQEIGKIIATGDGVNPGLAELRDRAGMLPISAIDIEGPVRTSEADAIELGDAQRVWLTVTWGESS